MFTENLYQIGLEKQESSTRSISAGEKVISFYNKNRPYCDFAWNYYNEYKTNVLSFVSAPQFIQTKNSISKLASGSTILVVTANPIEEGVFLRELSSYYNTIISSYLIDSYVLHIINNNQYTLIHIHAKRTGDEFTRRAINVAEKAFKINYVVLLGICYGINYNKQKLCSVVISNNVNGYRINFRDSLTSDEIEFEVETEFEEKPNKNLIEQIDAYFNYIQPCNEDLSTPQIRVNVDIKTGKILSSNCLMSSKKVKNSVLKAIGQVKPKPMAGEMESCGIFKSNLYYNNNFNNWLVIKSICDWGENKNNLPGTTSEEAEYIKDSIQSLAMMNSWIALKSLLESNIIN